MAKKVKQQPDEIKESVLISDLDSLREFMETTKLNPMEKVMAMNLLLKAYRFYAQYKIDVPEGWLINGRQYFLADFYIPSLNLVIETDGKIHIEDAVWRADLCKNNVYACLSYFVFRFTWDDVMGNNDQFDVFELFNQLDSSYTMAQYREWKRGFDQGDSTYEERKALAEALASLPKSADKAESQENSSSKQ